MLGFGATRRAAYMFVIAVAALLAAPATPIAVSPARSASVGQETAGEVYKDLGVDKERADYIILLDVSGSMSDPRRCNCYSQVSAAIVNFAGALDASDRVLLVPFAESAPYPRSVQPQWVTPGSAPDALLAKIPTVAGGVQTDIGLALQAGVAALESPDTSSIATVVMLTDGSHQPLRNSPYRLIGAPAWRDLADRVAALDQVSLNAFGIPLNGADGVGLMATIFPKAEVLGIGSGTTDVSGVTARLEEPKERARRAKASALVKDDLSRGLEISWPTVDVGSGSSKVTLNIRSTTTRLPLVFEGVTAVSSNPQVTIRVPDTVIVPPGQTVPVEAELVWHAGDPSWKYDDPVGVTTNLTLRGTVTSPWENVLTQDLAQTFEPTTSGLSQEVTFTAQLGRPRLWYAGLGVLAAIAVAIALMAYLRTHPRIRGKLLITHMSTEVANLPLRGRRMRLRRSDTLKGSGVVKGRWFQPANGRRRLVLEIRYRPDARAVQTARSSRVEDGDSMLLYGLRFAWNSLGLPLRLPMAAAGKVLSAPTLVVDLPPRPASDPGAGSRGASIPSAVATLDPPEPPADAGLRATGRPSKDDPWEDD